MIKKIAENVWELKKEGKMNVPGIVFASDVLMEKIKQDKTLEQIKNVACLPGIVEKSIAMMDAHWGYGFCVGGVAAFGLDNGIISPGGIGFDVNCGIRLLASGIDKNDFMKKRKEVLQEVYKSVPAGVGEKSDFRLGDKEINEVLEKGVGWALAKGYANKDDIERIEDAGCIAG